MRWTIPHGGGMVEVLSKRSLPSMYLAEALCISLIAVGSICGSLKNGYRSRGIDPNTNELVLGCFLSLGIFR